MLCFNDFNHKSTFFEGAKVRKKTLRLAKNFGLDKKDKMLGLLDCIGAAWL